MAQSEPGMYIYSECTGGTDPAYRYGIHIKWPDGRDVYIPEAVARRLVDEKADDEEVAAWMLGVQR